MFKTARRGARTLTAITVLTMGALAFSQGRSGAPKVVGGGQEAEAVATALQNPQLRREAELMGRQLLAGHTAAAAQNAESLWRAAGLDVDDREFVQFKRSLVELAEADSIIQHFHKHNVSTSGLTEPDRRKIHEINRAFEHFRSHSKGWPPALIAAVSHGVLEDFERIVVEAENAAMKEGPHGKGGPVGWLLTYADRLESKEFAELAGHLRWLERQKP